MQKLARHSTVELTIGRYTHTNINDLGSAVQQMIRLPLTDSTGQTTQPNGSSGQILVALMVAGFSDSHSKSVRTADDRPPTDEPVKPENTDSRNPCQRKTLGKDCGCLSVLDKAERQGFEPWVPLRVLRFSSRVLLTSSAVYLECCAVPTPRLHHKYGVRCQSQCFQSPAYPMVFHCPGTRVQVNGTRSSIASSFTSGQIRVRRWKSTSVRKIT